MNETRKQATPVGDDGQIEALLRHAGARPRPPAEDEAAVREALLGEWRALHGRQVVRRRVAGLALAATVLLALSAAFLVSRPPQPGVPAAPLGAVARVSGTVTVTPAAEGVARTVQDALLVPGSVIATAADGRVALAWTGGASVRLDHGARLRLLAADRLALERGRIYVDTGAGGVRAPLTVATPLGEVRHIGTQFMTALTPRGLEVSVREGAVAVDAGRSETTAARGERLAVSDDGNVSLEPLPEHDAAWAWAAAVAPPFAMEGRTVAEFLAWVARETGREVVYASNAAERRATVTRLHGDIDAPPLEALDGVMRTSDLAAEVREGEIVVREGAID